MSDAALMPPPAGEMTPAQRRRVERNRWLVGYVLKHFAVGRRMDPDDRASAAYFGLVRAAIGYDESMGHRFSTYAVRSIARRIRRDEIECRVVRVPNQYYYAARRSRRPEHVAAASQAMRVRRLDAYRAARIAAPEDDGRWHPADVEALSDALGSLPAPMGDVLRLHAEGASFREIGERVGLSRDRARRAYHRGVERLRRALRGGRTP